MATSQVFRGRVAVDALTVGGVRIDPAKLAEGDGGGAGEAGAAIVPQPVPGGKVTVAALTEALVAAGVLVESDDE